MESDERSEKAVFDRLKESNVVALPKRYDKKKNTRYKKRAVSFYCNWIKLSVTKKKVLKNKKKKQFHSSFWKIDNNANIYIGEILMISSWLI